MIKARKVASLAIDQSKDQKKKVILEAQKEKRTIHFGTLVDICDLKNTELEPKYQKYKGRVVLQGDFVKDDTFDTFFGIEHRLRKWRNSSTERPRKDGCLAASAARITEEMAGDEDRKHTSGVVLVAIDSNLGAVVGAEEGAIESIPGNEGRIAQAWVECKRRTAYLLSLLLAFRGVVVKK